MGKWTKFFKTVVRVGTVLAVPLVLIPAIFPVSCAKSPTPTPTPSKSAKELNEENGCWFYISPQEDYTVRNVSSPVSSYFFLKTLGSAWDFSGEYVEFFKNGLGYVSSDNSILKVKSEFSEIRVGNEDQNLIEHINFWPYKSGQIYIYIPNYQSITYPGPGLGYRPPEKIYIDVK